jgi:hypothetical protein
MSYQQAQAHVIHQSKALHQNYGPSAIN